MTRTELLQIAKPILFNTEMVKAILGKRKTVTRRLLKLPKNIKEQDDGLYTLFAEGTCYENQHIENIIDYLKKPCQPGDILYIRETWMDYAGRTMYKADCDKYRIESLKLAGFNWHPSLHMPKEITRIFLKVKYVHLERLQDMNGRDVLKEGLNSLVHPDAFYFDMNQLEMFEQLWNSTIKKSDLDKYGWEANPWVWVIEFEQIVPKGE